MHLTPPSHSLGDARLAPAAACRHSASRRPRPRRAQPSGRPPLAGAEAEALRAVQADRAGPGSSISTTQGSARSPRQVGGVGRRARPLEGRGDGEAIAASSRRSSRCAPTIRPTRRRAPRPRRRRRRRAAPPGARHAGARHAGARKGAGAGAVERGADGRARHLADVGDHGGGGRDDDGAAGGERAVARQVRAVDDERRAAAPDHLRGGQRRRPPPLAQLGEADGEGEVETGAGLVRVVLDNSAASFSTAVVACTVTLEPLAQLAVRAAYDERRRRMHLAEEALIAAHAFAFDRVAQRLARERSMLDAARGHGQGDLNWYTNGWLREHIARANATARSCSRPSTSTRRRARKRRDYCEA